MGFTETTFFFVLLPASIILYLFTDCVFHNNKINNILLGVFSLFFYFWAQREAFLIFIAICVFTYMAGIMVEEGKEKKKIAFSVLVLIGVLLFYKYISLLISIINTMLNREIFTIRNLIVPIGLSFVVFESISYIVDIYRGNAAAGTLLDCLVFLSLFPKLVSGPIVLWKNFYSQLKDRKASIDQVTVGIDRIIIGYAKKLIIADALGAQIVLINNGIAIDGVDIPTIWLRAVIYFFQIYYDFSGYSDIAIGLCNIYGFSLQENFRYPYLSKSVSEFWRRWHISLGTWFREYVYIPMGGNRKGNVYVHLLIVFLLTGIWHGVGINFVLWGGIHGIFVLIERAVQEKNWYRKIPACIKWLLTTVIVFFAWIMFMSKDIVSMGQSFSGMFVPMTTDTINYTWKYYFSRKIVMLLLAGVLGHLYGIPKIQRSIQSALQDSIGLIVKRILLLALFVVDIVFLVNASYTPFLYFQF